MLAPQDDGRPGNAPSLLLLAAQGTAVIEVPLILALLRL
jgi:hypothetical protein